MQHSLEALESIIRKRVCSVCSDRTGAGDCGLETPSTCALFRLFPQVALAIQTTRSNEIQPYIDAIRRNVCPVCEEQSTDGACESRRQVHCALDAYLLLIVDAIEDATGKTFNRSELGPGLAAFRARPEIRL